MSLRHAAVCRGMLPELTSLSLSQESSAITYSSPPLVEVAMAVQFEPPPGLNQAHLGAFWSTRSDKMPKVRVVGPISSTNEDFESSGRQWLPPMLQIELTDSPDARIQMTSDDEQWMCQVQLDRFVINWRKRNAEYPRFHKTLDCFRDYWTSWLEFTRRHSITIKHLKAWELTYVNRIPTGSLWTSTDEWPKIFPGLWGAAFASPSGVNLRGFHGQWVWGVPDNSARLFVEPKPSRSNDTPPKDLLILSLTAKGPIMVSDGGIANTVHDPEFQCIEAGMDKGHKLIVSMFDSITSEPAKIIWGRNDNTDS